MRNVLDEVINRHVEIYQASDDSISVLLHEGPDKAMIIMHSFDMPGTTLTMELAEQYAERLREALGFFGQDLIKSYWEATLDPAGVG